MKGGESMSKTTTVILVVIALLVGAFAGFWVERSRATAKMEEYKMVVQKQMDDAKKMAEDQLMKAQNAAMGSSVVLMTKGTNLLTDSKGMTLYIYDKDTKNTSNCTGKCLVNWPPFLVTGTVPSTLPEHIGTIKLANGSMQYTHDEMPLYYYIGDKKPGDTTGDGVGGIWHVVK